MEEYFQTEGCNTGSTHPVTQVNLLPVIIVRDDLLSCWTVPLNARLQLMANVITHNYIQSNTI